MRSVKESATKEKNRIAEQKLPPVAVMRLALKLSNFFRKIHYRGTPAPLAMLELSAVNYVTSCMTMTVAELGIADLLKDSAKSAEELAALAGVDLLYLSRLMRALTSLGIFAQDKEGRFTLTGISRYLLSDTPGSVRPLLVMFNKTWHKRTWDELTQTVVTGRPAFEQLYGLPLFDYLGQNPEAGQIFYEAMFGYSSQVATAVVSAYNFSRFHHLVDVGGGFGNVAIPLMKKYPKLRVTLFDLPFVIDQMRGSGALEGLQGRCELVGGSFFEQVPPGADAYLVNNVLHDWSDAQCLVILQACRRAMDKKAILLLSEQVLPTDTRYHLGKITDMEMGVFFPGGRERTLDEYRGLCEKAGFRLVRSVATPSFASVMECVPQSES
ncbi:MAG: hypothetical protein J2P37_30175 [Ktedonobacteraceae bacterium]|nr:hypothetical protein [Ktedonobacteraceae bacterium]MBO0794541.1 hypothetical protein [Ktedonobacteraceae bacterium]